MSYYISPRFLDKLSVHITKNYLNLPGVKVPLILGIHGRKGEGKTFQCELVYERIGVEVIHISAGELESPDAGDPARMLRLRYREAAELVKVRGKMAVVMINDIDAGAGRVDEYTQYTVNTQLVNATLMNIADNPTNVQLPGSYELEPIRRIPIIVTGNDFSTLYAPMIRDGRMEKFFWEPTRDDRIGIVSGILGGDGVSKEDVIRLVDTYPEQAIDFYSAVRSRLYDEQIRAFIQDIGLERLSLRIVNSAEPPPEFRKPDFSLPHLLEMGAEIVREQERIHEMRLAEQYNKSLSFNRKLGETTGVAPRQVQPSAAGFYRAYAPGLADSPNGQPEARTDSHTSSYAGQPSSNNLTPAIVTAANQILGQGYRMGIEYVDDRRFRTNAWNCYGTFDGNGADAMAALETCLAEHRSDYVRLVGIHPKDRHRVIETIVQRPPDKGGAA